MRGHFNQPLNDSIQQSRNFEAICFYYFQKLGNTSMPIYFPQFWMKNAKKIARAVQLNSAFALYRSGHLYSTIFDRGFDIVNVTSQYGISKL